MSELAYCSGSVGGWVGEALLLPPLLFSICEVETRPLLLGCVCVSLSVCRGL